MNLTMIQQQIELLSQEHGAEIERHRRTLDRINGTMLHYIQQRDLAMQGENNGKIQIAKQYLNVWGYGRYGHDPEVQSCIAAAVADIARGNFKIRRKYFAVKGFPLERYDQIYGQGTFEGELVFTVGLTPAGHIRDFEPDEIEAMVFYLVRFLY